MKPSSLFPRVGVIVGVATISVLLSGCKQVQQKAQEVVQQAATGLITESELSGITDPLVRKNLVAQANVKAYRISTASSGRGEGNTVTELQISGTEVRFHTQMTVNNKPQSEMIVIGDTTYIKDFSDNKWWKQVATPTKDTTSSQVTVPTLDEIKSEVTKKQQVATFKQLGTEPCGSLTCYKYQEIDSDNKEANRTFWFDNKDFLLRKETQKFGEFTSTNEYSYDNVGVNAPSPTKDVPQGKNIYEMMVPGAANLPTGPTGAGASAKPPTQEEINKLMQQYGANQ